MLFWAGVVSVLAGRVISGFIDAVGTFALFSNPAGLAVDTTGNVFVADTFNSVVRKVASTGCSFLP